MRTRAGVAGAVVVVGLLAGLAGSRPVAAAKEAPVVRTERAIFALG